MWVSSSKLPRLPWRMHFLAAARQPPLHKHQLPQHNQSRKRRALALSWCVNLLLR